MFAKDSCFQFPCSFPLKVMGRNSPAFEAAVRVVLCERLKETPVDYSLKSSSGGKYLCITATFTATSKEQLDSIYQALNDHELVVMTL